MTVKSAFVSGGAGFIGSHLCERLLELGYKVKAFDSLLLGRRELLVECLKNPKFEFVEADLIDLERVKKEMNGFDVVFHLAANSDISQGAARTDVDMRNGTIATYNVLEAMRINSIKKIIFPSTSAIYGEASVKPTPESYGPLCPISFYGASKLACEAMVSAFSHNCGIQAWVFRFANIVGSHATHGAIYDFTHRLLKQPERLSVLGNGTQRKSYLHVSDCVNGILAGFEKAQGLFQCYNLASRGVSNVRFIAEEVAKQVAMKTGINPKVEFGESDRGWVGDVPYTFLDGSLLETLGWRAKFDSDEAVRRAVSEVVSETSG